MTHPTIPELGPVTDREYLIHIGVLTDVTPIGMDPELIKAAIRMKDTTPARLADEMGLCASTFSMVIAGRGKSARVMNRIAEVTGIPVSTMWPEKPSLSRRGNGVAA